MPTATSEIAAALAALATQPALFSEASFAQRADALDELEFHVLDRLEGLLAARPTAALHRLRTQATALKSQFEAVDQQLFQRLRAAIRAGQHPPESLRALLLAYAAPTDSTAPATDYDSLDVLTEGLFIEPGQPLDPAARDPEMVYYQKTPARIILALAAKLTPEDTFYDLGSGLGQVPLLAHLLSGATATGVEIEPTYCRHAQACAAALHLPRVRFRCADARAVDYADATAFYLFTPFTGRILQQVLARLQQLAQHKPLRVFSYGPGTAALTQEPWLHPLAPPAGSPYQLAEFWSA